MTKGKSVATGQIRLIRSDESPSAQPRTDNQIGARTLARGFSSKLTKEKRRCLI